MNKPKKTPLSAALLVITFASLAGAQAQAARIEVQADQVIHPVSRFLTGACLEDVNHEIYGGIYTQMIFGESVQEPPTAPRPRRSRDSRPLVEAGAAAARNCRSPVPRATGS